MPTTTKIVIALAALVAMSSVASADPGCPDCHTQPVPIKNDCGYSSAHQGAHAANVTDAARGELCVANAHHKQGPWVKLGLCFEGIVNKVAQTLGLKVNLDLYASQDGVDLDSSADVAGQHVDYERSPLGKTDDMTWPALAQVHGQVDDKVPVNTRDVPVGGDTLPHANVDVCAKAKVDLGIC